VTTDGGLNLLDDVRVIEFSIFSPDALGGHLADLGAEVIKVEPPGGGGFRGELFDANNVEDISRNRGKKSVAINLKTPQGRQTALDLVAKSDVVINGLRSGALDRLRLSFEDLIEVSPQLVYCSLNGMGSNGRYAQLPTHGLSFDCFAGLTPPVYTSDRSPRLPGGTQGLVGVTAGPLYAALGVLAALHRTRSDGLPQQLEVAQVDAAIAWNFRRIYASANALGDHGNEISDSVRYQYYETSDERLVVFMALEDKFWQRFCAALDRMDLYEPGREANPRASTTQALRSALTEIFRSRTRAEWVDFFLTEDVAGAPAYLDGDLLDDPHVDDRALIYDQTISDQSSVRMVGSPLKFQGHRFAPTRAPQVGEHTEEVLADLLGLENTQLAALRASHAI
jgi:crotonobetainyl-CoA:carnitine CoA-transferase CaiB-like acyl-CoA transferase